MADADEFVFRKNDRIGDPSAEQDPYLDTCFVDTGDLAILKDCTNPRAVIVGRTGSGKSALLRRLGDGCEHCVEIDLHALAVSHITGSTILTYFERDLGVKLDQFYRFLWRHVFVVEILKSHYNWESYQDWQKWFDYHLSGIVHNKGRRDAFGYLNRWEANFWTTSEERIRAITTYIESELSVRSGIEIGQLATLGVGGKITVSEQQEREIAHRGREIINGVQMSHLSALMDALDEDILTNPKRRQYVIVDFLDERWVTDERLRLWLIRGLIETVRDFNRKIRNAKIVIALRLDLLRRMYVATSDSGFQEEKYEALNLAVLWSRGELERVLDERVQQLVRQRYTKQPVRLRDILPTHMHNTTRGGESGVDYLLDRTLMRPRDAIQFLNACLEDAVGKPHISIEGLHQAEARYSQQRRTAVADEWSEVYPYLILLTDLLKGRRSQFMLSEITDDELVTMCLNLHYQEENVPHPDARDVEIFDRFYNAVIGAPELRAQLAQAFYTVGFIGVRLAGRLAVSWSSESGPASLNSAEIHDGIRIHIHKAFWRVLGINTDLDRI